MKEKLQNPKETICVLLYKEPLPIEEISKILYGSRNSRVSGYVNELAKKEWLKIKLGKDGRERICYVTSKGMLDSITKDLKKRSKKYNDPTLILTLEEKRKLKAYLSSPAFKTYMSSLTKSYDFSAVKEEIGIYCIFRDITLTYLLERTGIDYTKPDAVNEMLKDAELIESTERRQHIKDLVSLDKLGFPLITKLSNLLRRPNPNLIADYFKDIIKFVEGTNQKLEEKNVKNVNGNGHGLS